jgi:DNA modification methylase
VAITILNGDVLTHLRELPEQSVQCVVTSPPYWGLRDYGTEGQIGLEKTPEEYTQKMVEVFREVKRVLRDDGTLWLNLGDSYSGSWGDSGHRPERDGVEGEQRDKNSEWFARNGHPQVKKPVTVSIPGLKPKDLVGIPWRVAFALQADGWYLRSDIIWSKPNPMPESVTDRPTKAHEYVFLLSKKAKYYYDADAVREPHVTQENRPDGIIRNRLFEYDSKENQLRPLKPKKQDQTGNPTYTGFNARYQEKMARNGTNIPGHSGNYNADGECLLNPNGRNRRTVWEIATQPTPEAHFATFPEALVEPCIKAGTSERGCCPVCGSPWERVIEKESLQNQKEWTGNNRKNGCIAGGGHEGRTGQWECTSQTTGWKATCRCWAKNGRNDTVPCVVLDPFGGSGTTGLVARNLKRDCILIELNPAYVKIMKKKLRLNEQLAV